jgi:hypothetical protein
LAHALPPTNTGRTHQHSPSQELCADPANEVLIFSGSEMAKLEETFGGLRLWLAAENGVYVKPPAKPGLPQARV